MYIVVISGLIGDLLDTPDPYVAIQINCNGDEYSISPV